MVEQNFRVYGMADETNRTPPGEQGYRGERAAEHGEADLRHQVPLGNGRSVQVEETSGVAFVEATGAARPKPRLSLPAIPPHAVPLGWLVAAFVAGLAIGHRRRERVEPADMQRVPSDAVLTGATMHAG